MELQANIRKDDCKCVLMNGEPVLTLAKERRESWRGLLKQKVSWAEPLPVLMGLCHSHSLADLMQAVVMQNPNVAFDFDHWEEGDEDSPFAKGETCSPAP
jgi:ATP-dependent RNA helicase TDRD12